MPLFTPAATRSGRTAWPHVLAAALVREAPSLGARPEHSSATPLPLPCHPLRWAPRPTGTSTRHWPSRGTRPGRQPAESRVSALVSPLPSAVPPPSSASPFMGPSGRPRGAHPNPLWSELSNPASDPHKDPHEGPRPRLPVCTGPRPAVCPSRGALSPPGPVSKNFSASGPLGPLLNRSSHLATCAPLKHKFTKTLVCTRHLQHNSVYKCPSICSKQSR